jgi:hypothetical protein
MYIHTIFMSSDGVRIVQLCRDEKKTRDSMRHNSVLIVRYKNHTSENRHSHVEIIIYGYNAGVQGIVR